MEAYFEAKARLFEPDVRRPGRRQPRQPLRPPAARRGRRSRPTGFSLDDVADLEVGAAGSRVHAGAATPVELRPRRPRSTWPTPWPPPRRPSPSGSIRRRHRRRAQPAGRRCPGASSWSTPASRSRSSSTTPTPPTGSSSCSPRRATSPATGRSPWCSGAAATATPPSARPWVRWRPRLADRVVLTADNSRGEDTGAIIDAVSRDSNARTDRRATELRGRARPPPRPSPSPSARGPPGDVVRHRRQGPRDDPDHRRHVVPVRRPRRSPASELARRLGGDARDPPPRRRRHRAGRVARRHPVPHRRGSPATGSASRSARTARPGHITKAGTPTMGGIAIVVARRRRLARRRPVRRHASPGAGILVHRRHRRRRRSSGFLDDWLKVSQGAQPRPEQAGQDRSACWSSPIGFAVGVLDVHQRRTPPSRSPASTTRASTWATSAGSSGRVFLILATTNAREPHRRPRRPGRRLGDLRLRRLRRHRLLGLPPPARLRRPALPRPRRHRRRHARRAAPGSCGGTRRRPGSSWATPASLAIGAGLACLALSTNTVLLLPHHRRRCS